MLASVREDSALGLGLLGLRGLEVSLGHNGSRAS